MQGFLSTARGVSVPADGDGAVAGVAVEGGAGGAGGAGAANGMPEEEEEEDNPLSVRSSFRPTERHHFRVLPTFFSISGIPPCQVAAAALLESPQVGQGGGVGSKKKPRVAAPLDPLIFTCTVGKKPSVAGFYVENVAGVESLLEDLTRNL